MKNPLNKRLPRELKGDIGNVFVMEYCTVTGCFHSICPKSYVSVLEVKRGCATAVNAVAASAYKVIKLRFIYIVSKLAAQM